MHLMMICKEQDVYSETLSFAATASSALSEIVAINEMKLKTVVNDDEHLLLIL